MKSVLVLREKWGDRYFLVTPENRDAVFVSILAERLADGYFTEEDFPTLNGYRFDPKYGPDAEQFLSSRTKYEYEDYELAHLEVVKP